MKVLVTGATGFIGNYVVEELLTRGHDVVATSLNPEKAAHASWFKKVSYHSFDIRNTDPSVNYYSFFSAPDALIHLAWEGLPNYKAAFHLTENLPSHLKFLENLIKNGLDDITVAGTCLEYGMQEGCLSEDLQSRPGNPYAAAKDELRKKLLEMKNIHPFHLKWARLFYMYGKGQSPNSLLSQLDKAIAEGEEVFNMSGGEQERDYLPVERMAEYLVSIATQRKVEGIINCCSGKPVKLKDFVEAFLKDRGVKMQLNLGFYPYTDYEPMRFWGDNKRLQSILNNE